LVWQQHANFAPAVEEEGNRSYPDNQNQQDNAHLHAPHLDILLWVFRDWRFFTV
jgi:hypothetical protein